MSIVVSAPKRARRGQAHLGAAHDDHLTGAAELGQDRGGQSDRARALDEDRVAELHLAQAHRVQRGRHAAAGGEEGAPVELGRERDDVDAGPEMDVLGPAAEQAFVAPRA